MRTFNKFFVLAGIGLFLCLGCGSAKHQEGTTNQSGTGATTTVPIPGVDPTIQAHAMSLLSTKCGSCHTGSSSYGGFNCVNDVKAMVAQGFIRPGDAAHSPVYTTMNNGTMPPGGGIPATDIQSIKNWIDTAVIQ